MKKSLLLCASVLMLCGNLQARKWDFTSWSTATYTNLMAGAFENCNTVSPTSGWSDVEKSNGTAPTAESKAKCFWEVTQQGTEEGATLVANGVAIAELEGLKWVHTNAPRNLAIAVDYPSTSLGSYHGASYLWLGGSKKNYFYIPNVALGTDITIGVESHKPAEGRGIELYAGSGHNTSGKKLADAEGNNVAVPTIFEEQTWRVPEDLTEGLNEDGTVDVLIYNTNGCHLYFIDVKEGDDVPVVYNVAYVYDSSYGAASGFSAHGGLEADPIYLALSDNFTMTPLDVNSEDIKNMTTEFFNDSLIKFDAVVLSEAIGSGDAKAKAMSDIINKVPLVNFKSFMYKKGAWSVGAGVNPNPKATYLTVNEDYLDSKLFEGLDVDDAGNVALFYSDEVSAGNLIQAYSTSAGSLFENDEVLATVVNGDGVANAIHIHSNRNQYVLLPLSSDNLIVGEDWNVTDNATKLAVNAVNVVAATKAKVLPAATPAISQEKKDGVTTVSIACSSFGSKIYYTTDGTEPTEASPVYSEPFDVTVNGTVVKAFAVAQGYDISAVATATIEVMNQTAAPVISVDGETFTIAGVGTIYYNVIGAATVDKSVVYTAAVKVPFDCTVTAFAVEEGKLQSEVATAEVTTSNIYKYEIAHVNFKESWVKADGSAVTKSTLNKKYGFFLEEGETSEHQMVIPASDGSDSIAYYRDSVLTYSTLTEGNAWTVSTNGANIAFSTDGAEGVVSTEGGNTAYGAADAFAALLYTKNAFTFGEINHSRDAEYVKPSITSGQKYPLPFKITALITGGLGKGANQSPEYRKETDGEIIYQRMEVLVSTDKENWTLIDTISTSCNKMADAVSVVCEGSDEVYVRLQAIMPLGTKSSSDRKINLNDLYIFSNNETLGIENISDNKVVKNDAVFDMMGRQVAKMVPGQIYIKNNKKVIVR